VTTAGSGGSRPDDVSVVLCTRNGWSRGFLDEAMRSVVDQSAPPAEVVLVDDGSSDGTAAEISRRYPEVRVVSNARRGLAAARNTGIRHARHHWIAFADDDDIWCREKLAAQRRQAEQAADAEWVVWAPRYGCIQGRDRETVEPVEPGHGLDRWPGCLLGNPVAPSGVLLSKTLLDRVGPFDEGLRHGAAYQYWIRCLTAGFAVRYSAEIVLLHRRHANQMTGTARRVEALLDGERVIAPFLDRLSPRGAARIRAAVAFGQLRTLLKHQGAGAAARYWAATPLRPVRLDARAGLYLTLGTAACLAPTHVRGGMRRAALRVLLPAEPVLRVG
jgi:glycosyltransferase involved in cell wall biosynthesis